MSKKVLIVDTCLACVWMKVPEMEVAGPDNDRWDYDRVNAKIESESASFGINHRDWEPHYSD